MITWDAAVNELETVTAELDRSDPADLGVLARLIERRGRVVEAIAALAEAPDGASRTLTVAPELEIQKRLGMVRLNLRAQLSELYRARFHTQAYAAECTAAAAVDAAVIDERG
ncbi:MAG: hypothetical protein IT162_12465 [Bryobacterales bacterium]|nr:hypothetical protein [Bryobacterales bacterium]